jgi:membrane fusion protein (multidrug efflux system)
MEVEARGFVILMAAAALAVAACTPGERSGAAAAAGHPPQPVEVVTITRIDLTQSLSLVGSIEANESAQIHSEISGIVRDIRFEEGQQVRKGDVLLQIDDSEINAQVAQAQAAHALARQSLERAKRLLKSHSVSEAEHDQAVSAFDGATAELALLRTRAAKTRITAPFDGTVDVREVSPGDYVTNQTLITSVNDLSRLKMVFEVPERYLDKVAVGARLRLSADGVAPDQSLSGTVYFVSSTINPQTRSSVVKALLDAAPAALKPGMFANVELVLDVHPQALVVPEAAIANTTDGPRIVLAQPDGDGYTATLVPVRLGLRSEGLVEIEADEPLDERWVVSAGVGALALYPGTPLDPRPAASPTSPGP